VEWTALALVPLAHAVELAVTAAGPGWGTQPGDADVLVATPQQVMDAVRSSGVKLEAVEAVVVDGASDIEAMGGMESLESLFDNVPRTAQRVVVTGAMTPAVQDLVDRRVKRAIRYPVQAAVPDESPEANETTGVVGYVPVGEREKVDTVARLLGGGDGEAPPVLVCRTDERAAQVAEALSLRGFLVGDAGDDGDADVVVVGSTEALAEMGEGGPPGTVISFDVPADEESLRQRHGGERTGFVLVQPREMQHLREVAKRARLDARPAGVTGEQHAAGDELRRFRSELRRAIREEDIGAQMLVLEPLFEDFTAAEVAAAAAALLRRRPPAEPEPGAAAAPAPRAGSARAPGRESTAGAAPAAIARLFVGVGERDGVRAGDLMGAIAGEADIPGSSVGKIEIRDTFSIVEVPADAAQKVIDRVNGTTIKGRTTAWTLWVGAVGLALLGSPALAHQDWGQVTPLGWAALVFSGLFAIGLAYLIWYRGVERIGNTRTAIFGNLTPVVAMIAAAVLLHEQPSRWALLGAALTLGGVMIVRSDPGHG